MNNKNFKWFSLLLTLCIVIIGIVTALILWGINLPSSDHQSQDKIQSESYLIEYTPSMFPEIIETQIENLGFLENTTFTCLNDGCFSITGILKYTDSNLTSEMREQLIIFDQQPVHVLGHIGLDEDGNGTFILDQIKLSDSVFQGNTVTELIKTKTTLNDLIKVPFDEISLQENGVTFQKELPISIRIALYTLPAPFEPEQSEQTVR